MNNSYFKNYYNENKRSKRPFQFSLLIYLEIPLNFQYHWSEKQIRTE